MNGLRFYGTAVVEDYEVICEATPGPDGVIALVFVILESTTP